MPISKEREDYRFYKIWADMKYRCNNPKCKRFMDYGGRGIQYYPEWTSYDGFKKDMWKSYKEHCKLCGEKQTTLDRINVNDHYYKDNCRWADYTLQRVNVRNKEEYCGYNLITNQFYNFNNCAEFCERFGFVREAVTRVLSGKLNMHHNCIFVKIETNSHDAYMKLLDKAKTLFVKYPKLAEQNKQYSESKNENS